MHFLGELNAARVKIIMHLQNQHAYCLLYLAELVFQAANYSMIHKAH
jgi:hypothetical protein